MNLKSFSIFILILIGLSGCPTEREQRQTRIDQARYNFSQSARNTITVTNISNSEVKVYKGVDYGYHINNSSATFRIHTDYNKFIDIPMNLYTIEIEEPY